MILSGGKAPYAVLDTMRWRTPRNIVENMAARLGIEKFDLDAAGEVGAKHASRVITAEQNCLTTEWDFPGVEHVFFNPPWARKGITKAARQATTQTSPLAVTYPFPGTQAFVLRAAEQSRRHKLTVAALLPSSLDHWMKQCLQLADEVWFGPRIRFLALDGQLGPSPPGPHLVAVYRPHTPLSGHPGGPRVTWDWRPV